MYPKPSGLQIWIVSYIIFESLFTLLKFKLEIYLWWLIVFELRLPCEVKDWKHCVDSHTKLCEIYKLFPNIKACIMWFQFNEHLWQLGRMDIQLHVTRLMTSCLFQFDHVGANPYSLAEIAIATNNFKIQIGKGRFGLVYYGKLEDGQEVAIKVLDVKSNQGPSKFFNEVSRISRHFNDVVCSWPLLWRR